MDSAPSHPERRHKLNGPTARRSGGYDRDGRRETHCRSSGDRRPQGRRGQPPVSRTCSSPSSTTRWVCPSPLTRSIRRSGCGASGCNARLPVHLADLVRDVSLPVGGVVDRSPGPSRRDVEDEPVHGAGRTHRAPVRSRVLDSCSAWNGPLPDTSGKCGTCKRFPACWSTACRSKSCCSGSRSDCSGQACTSISPGRGRSNTVSNNEAGIEEEHPMPDHVHMMIAAWL